MVIFPSISVWQEVLALVAVSKFVDKISNLFLEVEIKTLERIGRFALVRIDLLATERVFEKSDWEILNFIF